VRPGQLVVLIHRLVIQFPRPGAFGPLVCRPVVLATVRRAVAEQVAGL